MRKPERGSFVMVPVDGVLREGHVIQVGREKVRVTVEQGCEDKQGRPKSKTVWVKFSEVV